MRNFLKAGAVMLLIAAVTVTGFAASPVKRSSSSVGSGGGGGGSSSGTGVTIYTGAYGNTQQKVGPTGVQTPSTGANAAAPGAAVAGEWSSNGGAWQFTAGGRQYRSEWVNAVNPYAGGAAQTFFFDAAGNMLTGWVKIVGADGLVHWYYFQTAHDGSCGQLLRNAVTPDGYTVNANGEWTVEGVVQSV